MSGPPSTETPGRLRRALARLTSSDHEIEAAELQDECVGIGAIPVAKLTDRTRATVSGTLRTVTLRPRAGVPALVAELYDGSGTISVIWLGRRQIAAVDPGRSILAEGLVTFDESGRPMMFNPRYELRPLGGPE